MSTLKNAFALLIGIPDEKLPVQPVNDVNKIRDILIDEEFAGYPPENVLMVVAEQATREGLTAAFDNLISRVEPDDSVFIYYSGHGGHFVGDEVEFVDGQEKPKFREIDGKKVTRKVDRYFLQTHGMDQMKIEDRYDAMFPAELLRYKLNQLNTNKLVFFFDCCHAAGMTEAGLNIGVKDSEHKEENVSFDSLEGLAQRVDNERGVTIISACREDQKSQAFLDPPISLFTECIADYIMAKHDPNYNLEYIYIAELGGFLQREVPRRAWSWLKPPKKQNPYLNLQNRDNFVICRAPKKVRERLNKSENEVKTELITQTQTKGPEKEHRVSWRDDDLDNLIILLHGFSGEASETFGQIPYWLLDEPDIKGWDIRPLGYSHHVNPEMGKDVWAGINDIERIVDELAVSIVHRFKKYSRIAIIAHSLGGLAAQKAILRLKPEHRDRISHLIMFCTPNNGISPQELEKNFNKKYTEMSSEGEFIKGLRNEWKDTFKDGLPFKIKTVAASSDDFVHYSSVFTEDFEEDDCVFMDGDHLRIVKPKDQDAPAYELIIKTLTDVEFAKDFLNKEEVNLIMGDYQRVYNELKGKANELGEKGLRQLIFAMEGIGGMEDEIVDILNNTESIKNKSDFCGFLGGRLKRAFLKNDLQKDGEGAINAYTRGLSLAEEEDVHWQIYYHAINLAFLNLVVKDDRKMMKQYANKALDAAEKCPDDKWKLATVGEASMYLGDMEKAQTSYEEAAKLSDIREKISIHLNAYNGYTTLMNTDDPNDAFIGFLKSNFLS